MFFISAIAAKRSFSLTSWAFMTVYWPMYFGFFIAGSHLYKQQQLRLRGLASSDGESPRLHFGDFFRAFFLFCPLFWLTLLQELMVVVGLICLILPGLYLMVAVSFAPFIYIEYHKQYDEVGNDSVNYGIFGSIGVSIKVVNAHFCKVLGFWVLVVLIQIAGALTIVGLVFTTPIVSLACIPAFQDLFGFQMQRRPDERCFCCC